MKKKTIKSFLAFLLSVAIAFSCLIFTQVETVQADETGSQQYLEVDVETAKDLMSKKQAPTKAGYLFAGWIARKSDGTGVAITGVDDEVLTETGVTVTAKFIPQHLAGVACQVKANTYQEGIDETELRVVSAVDGGDYQGFGFNLYKRVLKDAENKIYREDFLCGYNGTDPNPAETKVRYSGLYVYDSNGEKELKRPADIFGADAEGFYFTTVRITGIPESVYDSCIFIIKPYWITADGTYVEGLGEYDRVSDGKNGIVNISVNIKQAQAIAAGLVTVSYDQSKFEYTGADIGRVFEEMTFVDNGASISCVGNVADMNGNSLNPNDIFVNLRFKKRTAVTAGESDFTIDSKAFSNNQEVLTDAKVLDVTY